MIVFELICERQHRFEGWFASPGDFDSQKSRGLLECPSCASRVIEKLLTSKIRKPDPHARPADTARAQEMANLPPAAQAALMRKLVDHILANSEDVGKAFAEEARKIHYKEAPERHIRGIASPEEAAELVDEGIPVLPLPLPPRDEYH